MFSSAQWYYNELKSFYTSSNVKGQKLSMQLSRPLSCEGTHPWLWRLWTHPSPANWPGAMSGIRKLLWMMALISEDLSNYKDRRERLCLLAWSLNVFLQSVHTQFSDLGLKRRIEELRRAWLPKKTACL